MTTLIKLDQNQYSEWVVRNSLYWIDGEFTLEKKDSFWNVELQDKANEIQFTKLLNDYRLRELSILRNGSANRLVEFVVEQITSK